MTTAPKTNSTLLIGVLVAAAFVVILNETTLAVALPALMSTFEVSADTAQWLTSSFMLTMATVIPMTGYIMQRFTLRAIYIAALVAFLAGTVLATFAPIFPILLVARIIQATGTALVIPLLMTTIMRLIPVERRGSVLGYVTVVIAVAPALGPTFSGIVLQTLSWRWIFGLMIPLVLVALGVGVALVKNFEEPTKPYLDVPSVLLAALGFSATLYGLAGFSQLAEGLPVGRLLWLLLGLVGLFFFFRRQALLGREFRNQESSREPLLNLEPLGVREYTVSMTMMLFSFFMLFGFIILMPIFAQQVLGLSQVATGLVTLPGGLLMGLMGPMVGRLYDSKGARPLIIPGSFLLAVSLLGLALFRQTHALFGWISDDHLSYQVQLIVLSLVLHLGLALLFTPLMSNALAAVRDEIASHGQAILNTLQQVAGGAGTAVFIALMTVGAGVAAMSDPEKPAADVLESGIHIAFMVAAVASVVLFVFTVIVRIDVRHHEPHTVSHGAASRRAD
ncbi:MFS transporter [Corynebacterium auriscanis]|uniref:MFS transporter n=1 Tax=Corynebacterium auriscanis TaxID=99807 RepID=UPI003CE9E4F1